MNQIRRADSDEDILGTYQLMRQLHERVRKLGIKDYLALVRTQERETGYHLCYLTENEKVICAAGFRSCRSLGWGKYLYVDDLVTDERYRSTGVGKKMLDWLIAQGRAEGCDELRLDCRVDRYAAHRFYFREHMNIMCFHFQLPV